MGEVVDLDARRRRKREVDELIAVCMACGDEHRWVDDHHCDRRDASKAKHPSTTL